MSSLLIRLLRHDDTVHRENDGAVRFDDLAELFKSKFVGAWRWSIESWISFLAKGGGPKKRFQYCMNPNSSNHFLYFLAIKTMCCYGTTSLITSTTSGTLTTCTPSSNVD